MAATIQINSDIILNIENNSDALFLRLKTYICYDIINYITYINKYYSNANCKNDVNKLINLFTPFLYYFIGTNDFNYNIITSASLGQYNYTNINYAHFKKLYNTYTYNPGSLPFKLFNDESIRNKIIEDIIDIVKYILLTNYLTLDYLYGQICINIYLHETREYNNVLTNKYITNKIDSILHFIMRLFTNTLSYYLYNLKYYITFSVVPALPAPAPTILNDGNCLIYAAQALYKIFYTFAFADSTDIKQFNINDEITSMKDRIEAYNQSVSNQNLTKTISLIEEYINLDKNITRAEICNYAYYYALHACVIATKAITQNNNNIVYNLPKFDSIINASNYTDFDTEFKTLKTTDAFYSNYEISNVAVNIIYISIDTSISGVVNNLLARGIDNLIIPITLINSFIFSITYIYFSENRNFPISVFDAYTLPIINTFITNILNPNHNNINIMRILVDLNIYSKTPISAIYDSAFAARTTDNTPIRNLNLEVAAAKAALTTIEDLYAFVSNQPPPPPPRAPAPAPPPAVSADIETTKQTLLKNINEINISGDINETFYHNKLKENISFNKLSDLLKEIYYNKLNNCNDTPNYTRKIFGGDINLADMSFNNPLYLLNHTIMNLCKLHNLNTIIKEKIFNTDRNSYKSELENNKISLLN